MTGDEIYLYVDAGYEPADTAYMAVFSRAERSHEVCSDIV